MKSQALFASSSRKRLEEFRSKLESTLRLKSPKKDERPIQEFARKISPYARFKDFSEEIHKSVTPKRNQSPVLGHYRNLSYFKAQNYSPKAAAKPKPEFFKKPSGSYNIDLFNYSDRKSEKISDLISIEALSAATSIISRGGIKTVPKVYAAQLKEFCSEVLSHLRA